MLFSCPVLEYYPSSELLQILIHRYGPYRLSQDICLNNYNVFQNKFTHKFDNPEHYSFNYPKLNYLLQEKKGTNPCYG